MGGDLNALVQKPDSEVSNAFKQVMQALAYLHNRHIAHRDVKPENCLFINESKENLKVIDYGLAVVMKAHDKSEKFMHERVGTPSYMSPEMIARSRGYGVQTDVWSAGILLYFLLTGEHAFGAKSRVDQKKLFMKISTNSHNIAALNENGVVAQAQDLISHMLIKESAKRPSAKDVLGFSWLNTNSEMMSDGRSNMLSYVEPNFVTENEASRFQQGLLNDVAHEAKHELEELGRVCKAGEIDGIVAKSYKSRGARLLVNLSRKDQSSVIESSGKDSSGDAQRTRCIRRIDTISSTNYDASSENSSATSFSIRSDTYSENGIN